jgi:hypothetical protein
LLLTKGKPPLELLSQEGGPLGQEELGSQLEARRLPRTRGEGHKGMAPPNPAGESKTMHSPGPSFQNTGQSHRMMENHGAQRTSLALFGLSIAPSHSNSRHSHEPLWRPMGRACTQSLGSTPSCGPPLAKPQNPVTHLPHRWGSEPPATLCHFWG